MKYFAISDFPHSLLSDNPAIVKERVESSHWLRFNFTLFTPTLAITGWFGWNDDDDDEGENVKSTSRVERKKVPVGMKNSRKVLLSPGNFHISAKKGEKSSNCNYFASYIFFFSMAQQTHKKTTKSWAAGSFESFLFHFSAWQQTSIKIYCFFGERGKKGRWNCEKLLFLLVAVLRCSVNSDI